MVLQRIHAVAAIALVATIVIQVFLAGAAIAELGGSGGFAGHVEFGYTVVGIAALATLVTGIAARPGRSALLWVAAVFVDYIVQTLLPVLKSVTPALGALHPVNALVLFGLSVIVARRAIAASMAKTGANS